MNVLFLGQFYPKGIIENIVEDTRGKVGFSNHNFEMSLISGFSKHRDVNLRILTVPMVFSFPHNNKNAFIRKINYIENNYSVNSIGFCNIAVINKFYQKWALTKAIIKEIETFRGDEITVVVNTPSLTLSSALFKSLSDITGKKIKTVLIVPDVPECMIKMSGKMNLKNRIVQLLNKKNAQLSLRYDNYVYLTEAMNDFYQAKSSDYIVMEGLIDDSKVKIEYTPPKFEGNKEIILYTGTLRRIFGVMNLIEAFKKSEIADAELWICGSGECASEIEQIAKNNASIKFYGLVSSQKALELQSKATILANPRSSEGEYTKYSFPSKTIEYLLAGRTVIMNRLPGVPLEYDNYIEYPDDESIESWAKKMREIVDDDKENRLKLNIAGRKFILYNKTAKLQCGRILDLVKG